MNLSEIRDMFSELSGRLDLVTVDANGVYKADWYITAGSRLLDRLADVSNSEATAFFAAQAGSFHLSVPDVRSILRVYYYTSTSRAELRKGTQDLLRRLFSDPLTTENRGVPKYYIPVSFRVGSPRSAATPGDFMQHVDFTGTAIDGIMFPPIDTDGTFEVFGYYYSKSLVNDTDTNYWARHHPMLLAWAALYHLEVSYRNTSGAQDWMNSIGTTLRTIEFDHVLEVSTEIKQMGGREND